MKLEKVVIVGGCGHVGLPLGLVLASTGYKVTALDIFQKKVDLVNSGAMPFQEIGASELLKKSLENKSFLASTDKNVLIEAQIVIIVIGTPVDEFLNPDPNIVTNLIFDYLPFLKEDQLLILRSTVFPGVTQKVRDILKENGLNLDIAFCPERILEGQAINEIKTLPQIIGAETDSAISRTVKLFEKIGAETIVVNFMEAELAKLFTNVWRYIKFATANQFWVMSNEAGLDFSRILNAITRNYPRANDLPNAGFTAGPCLLKDTMQLAAFSDNNFQLGHTAMLLNEGLPLYIVNKIEARFDLSKLVVGILGMAFKGNSDDKRSSLAYKLKKILKFKARDVITSDYMISDDSNLVSQIDLLEKSDIIIIGAPHDNYKKLLTDKPVIDIWNILNKGNQI